MDLRRAGQDPSNRHSRVEPQSAPLPQNQWADVPLPYRPREMPDPADRPRPSVPGHALSSSVATPESSRNRRRPQALRNAPPAFPDFVARSSMERQARNPTHLYPGMSPYADRLPSASAPAEVEHVARSVSQPNSPSYFQQRFQESQPPFMHIPRSPTYPPAGRRRMHSASGVTDAAFADEEEFRLFVDATAGLGPEQAFRNASSPICTRDRHSRSTTHPSAPQQAGSPDEQTPTTLHALRQLAAMPLASTQHSRQRLQTSASGLDLWLQPPSRPMSAGAVSHSDDEDDDNNDDEMPPDDELPDYAQSQAQAQALQRAEAARRAQELQRRWHESSGVQGRYP
ncbi:hypothetical protein LTR35_007960 [Friedmanniomyces endolithicus]|nr:hypothetical protein LTS00_015345 [Friedmanniomyces endolithicus]KAK0280319.1 hypothetical protein LTR35_007960 [Friedmanniomyces endolithicus]KAK0828863.1 hypothetical protein LTR73_004495 [Friedmanniomyces endolithicus]